MPGRQKPGQVQINREAPTAPEPVSVPLVKAPDGQVAATEHTGVDRRKRDFAGRRPAGGAGSY